MSISSHGNRNRNKRDQNRHCLYRHNDESQLVKESFIPNQQDCFSDTSQLDFYKWFGYWFMKKQMVFSLKLTFILLHKMHFWFICLIKQ